MKLIYLYHSGFALLGEGYTLIFDYFEDSVSADKGIVHEQLLSREGQLYVFSSHAHADHFNRQILSWKALRPDIVYLLSTDIPLSAQDKENGNFHTLAKGDTYRDEYLTVRAFGSTDIGISFLVQTPEGATVFHAGDLNNWYARFLTDDYHGGLVYSPDFGIDIDPAKEEKRFLGELKDIRKLTDRFDVVMFPVDGRIGNGYTRGARQFLDVFRTGLFVPMHFVASGFESAWRMKEFTDAKSVPFWCIRREGECCEVKKHIEVVAAGMVGDGKYFATQRGYGEFKDYWEFPGGKVEPGESREEALVREIREELDTDIRVDAFLTTVNCEYPSFHLTMHCYRCSVVSGSLVLKEHESAGWKNWTAWRGFRPMWRW